jgi:hypothetical protein
LSGSNLVFLDEDYMTVGKLTRSAKGWNALTWLRRFESSEFGEPIPIQDINSDGSLEVIVQGATTTASGDFYTTACVSLSSGKNRILWAYRRPIPRGATTAIRGVDVRDLNGNGMKELCIDEYTIGSKERDLIASFTWNIHGSRFVSLDSCLDCGIEFWLAENPAEGFFQVDESVDIIIDNLW